jgi:hypothetical protein
LKVEERYDPFSYVWGTMRARWKDALSHSRKLSAAAASIQILTRYFEIAGFASERSIARVLAIPYELVESSAARLEREGTVMRRRKIEGVSGLQTVLSRLLE